MNQKKEMTFPQLEIHEQWEMFIGVQAMFSISWFTWLKKISDPNFPAPPNFLAPNRPIDPQFIKSQFGVQVTNLKYSDRRYLSIMAALCRASAEKHVKEKEPQACHVSVMLYWLATIPCFSHISHRLRYHFGTSVITSLPHSKTLTEFMKPPSDGQTHVLTLGVQTTINEHIFILNYNSLNVTHYGSYNSALGGQRDSEKVIQGFLRGEEFVDRRVFKVLDLLALLQQSYDNESKCCRPGLLDLNKAWKEAFGVPVVHETGSIEGHINVTVSASFDKVLTDRIKRLYKDLVLPSLSSRAPQPREFFIPPCKSSLGPHHSAKKSQEEKCLSGELGFSEFVPAFAKKLRGFPPDTPSDPGPAVGCGIQEYEANNFHTALALFTEASELGHAGAIVNMGLCYQQLGDKKKAKECYLKAARKGRNVYLHLWSISKSNGLKLYYYLEAIKSAEKDFSVVGQLAKKCIKLAEKCSKDKKDEKQTKKRMFILNALKSNNSKEYIIHLLRLHLSEIITFLQGEEDDNASLITILKRIEAGGDVTEKQMAEIFTRLNILSSDKFFYKHREAFRMDSFPGYVESLLVLFNFKYGAENPLVDSQKHFSDALFQLNDPIELVKKGVELVTEGNDKELQAEQGALYRKAFELFEASARQGNPDGDYHLGLCYEKGWGTPKDEKKAFKNFKKAAEQGHAGAQYQLWLCYKKGSGTAKNEDKANALLQLMDPIELVKKGVELVTEGNDKEPQAEQQALYRTAIELFEASAGQGNADGYYQLGLCYKKASKARGAKEQAFVNFENAAKKGHAGAQCQLGLCYEKGWGTPRDEKKAFENFKKAAEQGHAGAQYQLGLCYKDGIGIVEKDEDKAYKYFEKAAEQGHAGAQYQLGLCYKDGIGIVEKDKHKAFENFKKAAEQGHTAANYVLVHYAQTGKWPVDDPRLDKFSDTTLQSEVLSHPQVVKYLSEITGESTSESKKNKYLIHLGCHLMIQLATNVGAVESVGILYMSMPKLPMKEFKDLEKNLKSFEDYIKVAMHYLPEFCVLTEGLKPSKVKAIEYLKKAEKELPGKYDQSVWMLKALIGCLHMQIHYEGHQERQAHYQKAILYLGPAIFQLGEYLYRDGTMIKSATDCFKMAEKLGHVGAQFQFGFCDEKWSGTAKHEKKASSSYQQSVGIYGRVGIYDRGFEDLLGCTWEGEGMSPPEVVSCLREITSASELEKRKENLNKLQEHLTSQLANDEGAVESFGSNFLVFPDLSIADLEKLVKKAQSSKEFIQVAIYYLPESEGVIEGLKPSKVKAIEYLKKAEENLPEESVQSVWMLKALIGCLHMQIHDEDHYNKAIHYFRLAIFEFGKCLYPDDTMIKSATDCFKMAAKLGHVGALINLGICYQRTKDIKNARKCYLKAAAHGHPMAYYYLWGISKKNGSKSYYYSEAIRYAEENEAGRNAVENIAQKYLDMAHKETAKDKKLLYIVYALKSDAIKYDKDLINLIGVDLNKVLKELGEDPIKIKINTNKDVETLLTKLNSLPIIKKLDDPEGHFQTGMYCRGEVKGAKRAVFCFQKAAKQGHAGAQYQLGLCYKDGIGTAKDEKTAFAKFNEAAEQGHAEAQYELGRCYKKGRGIDKDEDEAFAYFKKAAEQGHAGAQFNIAVCYEQGRGTAKDEMTAFKFYKKASDQGHIIATYNLGHYYLTGMGNVEKDVQKAQECYKKIKDVSPKYASSLKNRILRSKSQDTHTQTPATLFAHSGGPPPAVDQSGSPTEVRELLGDHSAIHSLSGSSFNKPP